MDEKCFVGDSLKRNQNRQSVGERLLENGDTGIISLWDFIYFVKYCTIDLHGDMGGSAKEAIQSGD